MISVLISVCEFIRFTLIFQSEKTSGKAETPVKPPPSSSRKV